MGTKYRKTHNGEPFDRFDVLIVNGARAGAWLHEVLLEEGLIEPVPTVTVELDREIVDRFLGTYGNARSGSLDDLICSAFRAALND